MPTRITSTLRLGAVLFVAVKGVASIVSFTCQVVLLLLLLLLCIGDQC